MRSFAVLAIRKLANDLWETAGLQHESTPIGEMTGLVIYLCASLYRVADRIHT